MMGDVLGATTAPSQRWKPVVVAVVLAMGVAALGASATDIGPWYQALHKPWWQPPDLLFGPVWTIIYALTAYAGVLVWRAARPPRRMQIMALFALNALLNVLWSELFFNFHRPGLALIEVVPFWLSIVALMAGAGAVSRRAAWLLIPYLAWVAFAGYLNLTIVRLNQ